MRWALIVALLFAVGCDGEDDPPNRYARPCPPCPEIKCPEPPEQPVTVELESFDGESPRTPYYVLTLKSKKQRSALEALDDPIAFLSGATKDEMNALEFDIAVDPEVYAVAEVGKPLASRFTWGSVLLGGSSGDIVIVVSGKKTVPREE